LREVPLPRFLTRQLPRLYAITQLRTSLVLQLPHVAEIHAFDDRLHDRNALTVRTNAIGKDLRVMLTRPETAALVDLVVIGIDDHVVVVVPVDIGMFEATTIQQAADLDAILIPCDDREAGFGAFHQSKRSRTCRVEQHLKELSSR